jgi:hypothetical protein
LLAGDLLADSWLATRSQSSAIIFLTFGPLLQSTRIPDINGMIAHGCSVKHALSPQRMAWVDE